MATSGPKSKTKPPSTDYSGWKFARDFSKGIFQLLNTGKAYPAFGLIILAIVGIVAFRLPPDRLEPVVQGFFSTVQSLFGLVLALFIGSNLGWAWLMKRQKRIYESEIDRLSKIRSDLMHVQSSPLIANHRSSDEVTNETHIFPEALTKKPK
jgi:hypothetical protein